MPHNWLRDVPISTDRKMIGAVSASTGAAGRGDDHLVFLEAAPQDSADPGARRSSGWIGRICSR
jgi:hypothetical protein